MAEWKTLTAIYENGHIGPKRWATNPNWFMVADAMTAEAEAYRVDLSAFEDSQRKRIFEGDLRGLFDAWAKAVGWNYLGEDEAADFLSFAPDPHSWAAGMRKDISSLYADHMNDKKSGPIPGREAVTIHRWAIAVWDALKVADPYILPEAPTAAPAQEPAAPTQEPAAPEPTKATPWRELLRDNYGPRAEQIIRAFEIAVKREIAEESDDKTRLIWHGRGPTLLTYFCAMAIGSKTEFAEVSGREYINSKIAFNGTVFDSIWGAKSLNSYISKMRCGYAGVPKKGRAKIDEIVNLAKKDCVAPV